jgi:hypothetical protein
MSSPSQQMLAGLIPRRSPALITNEKNQQVQAIMRWFALLDDMNFDDNGVPARPFGTVQRQGTYSWAYMLKRPRMHEDAVVDLTVVVYQGRGLQMSGGVLDQTETLYRATGSAGSTTVQLPGATPPLRRGTWILDASQETTHAGMLRYGPVHGYFYRVVAVASSHGSTVLEVQTPLKADVTQMVVMDNVVEVFDKGPGWLP